MNILFVFNKENQIVSVQIPDKIVHWTFKQEVKTEQKKKNSIIVLQCF